MNCVTLLITITPNDRLLDQFCAVGHKVRKLPSFDYVEINFLVKISLDSEFSTTFSD